MIRRHISAAHICLRCQIRLGQRSILSSTRRAYSTESAADYEGNEEGISNGQSQYNGGESDRDGDTELYSERGIGTTRPSEWPPERHDDVVIRRVHVEVPPPRPSRGTKTSSSSRSTSTPKLKLYGYTGTKKFGDTVTLPGVNALGKSTDVLVMRDSIVKVYKREIAKIDEAPAPESIDILAKIESERGILSSEDIKTSIDEFKSQLDKIQTWKDFNDLVQSLQDGFSGMQLHSYIQSHPRKARMTRAPPLGVGIRYGEKATVRISPWVPETSPISQPIDFSPLRGYSLPSYTPKQILAVRILRECWRLEVPELVDGIGQVDIHFRMRDIDFLTNQGYLESVIKRYDLNEPEKIEISRLHQVIRITSRRGKSVLIIDDIQNGIRRIRREQVELKELCLLHYRRGWQSRTLTLEVLTKLGELTKTDIKILPHEESSILISSMVNDPESKLSKRVDVVKRLLLDLARYDGMYRDSSNVELRNSPHKVDLPGAFIRYPGSRELSWHERLRTWSRWITATPKSANKDDPTEKFEYQFPFNTTDVKLLGERQEDFDPKGAEALWAHEYSPVTSIKAGTLLHNITSHRIGKELDDDNKPLRGHATVSPDKTLNLKNLQSEMASGSTRVFSTQAPSLSGLFQSDQFDNPASRKPSQELVMRFKPNPWALRPNGEPIGPSAFDDFPPIEMSFKIDPLSYEMRLREIHAVVSTETADLMLPELKADLRFEREIRSRMLTEDSELDGGLDVLKSTPTAVKDFVEYSQLALTGDQPLETPPNLVLPLAKHLCTQNGWERMEGKPGLGIDVQYLFAKLEYRKRAVYNFENHEVSCTSIEAGKAGGSRLELSLACESMPDQDEMRKTMDVALKMVQLMDMKSITGVYAQVREVLTERNREPELEPDETRWVPKRPSDFLDVKIHYQLEEEKEKRFGKPAAKEDKEKGLGNPAAKEENDDSR
ncbi:hypothetical protein DSL72_007510 [Monilinia vaccinii-corymbosi]|uniref:Uncharacterized protein n=1 Tax=Monilinia vaccinii-corymbosi TaxID=61207 RepID=A0A8A3PI62_9HELO|nr:hypothetical protein DSL72_007510 [Monilinia vaccinii-corymbosi]